MTLAVPCLFLGLQVGLVLLLDRLVVSRHAVHDCHELGLLSGPFTREQVQTLHLVACALLAFFVDSQASFAIVELVALAKSHRSVLSLVARLVMPPQKL